MEIDRKSYSKIKMEQIQNYIEVNKAHMRRYKQQLDVEKGEVKNICNVFPYAD